MLYEGRVTGKVTDGIARVPQFFSYTQACWKFQTLSLIVSARVRGYPQSPIGPPLTHKNLIMRLKYGKGCQPPRRRVLTGLVITAPTNLWNPIEIELHNWNRSKIVFISCGGGGWRCLALQFSGCQFEEVVTDEGAAAAAAAGKLVFQVQVMLIGLKAWHVRFFHHHRPKRCQYLHPNPRAM